METITLILMAALAALGLLALVDGADSRPVEDARHWWPGTRDDNAAYPQHQV